MWGIGKFAAFAPKRKLKWSLHLAKSGNYVPAAPSWTHPPTVSSKRKFCMTFPARDP